MTHPREFYVDFEVKFGKTVLSIEMPATASVHDLKQKLEERTHVRIDKQRLLLNLPVMKEKHRDPPHETLMRCLFPAALVGRCEQHEGAVPQHLRVNAMLLGSAEVAPTVNVAATTEISRLVATTVEHDGKWYRCSYSKGYLRQTAYVCRTCVSEGRADPQHAICLACAEFCHGDHEVEEWGVRYYMRCDCCTEKCWRLPTGNAPATDTLAPAPTSAAPDATSPATTNPSTTATSNNNNNNATTAAVTAPSETRTVHMRDIEQRTMRKRSRSTSPLTPKRSRGSSPLSGIRMTTVPPTEMPDLDLQSSTAKNNPVAPTTTAANAKATVAAEAQHFPPQPLAPSQHGASVIASAETEQVVPAALSSAAAAGDANVPCERETKSAVMNEEASGRSSRGNAAGAPPPLPQLSRCAFVIDTKTNLAPVESVLPTNKLNRYPRDPLNWCYCKNAHPSDDPECGGIACLICASCYWSTHITKLYTAQYRRMPCYGDVLVGDTVAFKCNTCNTYVCMPCRYRCHKDHDIAPESVLPSREDGTDNGAIAGSNFSCGCRGLCAIAETVPEELIDDPSTYDLISDADAVQLINNDIFTGFVCSYCMQEYPWMAKEDPLKCYRGELPPLVPTKKPVIACGSKPQGTASASPSSSPTSHGNEEQGFEDAEVFPYHGMILPVNAFMPDMTCSCGPCRQAYEKFVPRALDDATEMIMELHDRCDNCGKSVKDQQAFMCRTCEMGMEDTYFICRDCNALRQMLMENRNRVRASARAEGEPVNRAIAADTDELPPPPPPQHPEAEERDEAENAEGEEEGTGGAEDADFAEQERAGYTHDLSHDFIEDTFENLYALCGMQMMQNMDPEMQAYVASNWNPEANQAEVANTLSQSLGQLPLQFSDEELREMATLNQKRKQSQDEPK